jgi:acyl-CoA synthetase (AMP-forming)/AMP-acid ligase II
MTPLTISHWPADTSSPILDTTVGGVLRTAARRAPDRVALIDGDRQWTYGELLAGAGRAARALLTRFAPGERIAVWAGNSPEWVLLEFAAGLAGLTLVTVNPAYQAEELAHVLGHCGARGLFLADGYRGSSLPAILAQVRDPLSELRAVIPLGEWPEGDGGQLPDVDPDGPAQILYTSGTTGRPKGVELTHANWVYEGDVVVVGDTGCRLQAASFVYQTCNDAVAWLAATSSSLSRSVHL